MNQEQKLFKVRADTMSVAHQWGCGGCVLGVMAFLLILISAAMPNFLIEYDGQPCESLMESQKQGVFCNKVNFNSPLLFQTYIMNIDPYSQFLYMKAVPMKAYYNQSAIIKTNLTYQLLIDEVRDDLLVTRTFKNINATATTTCDYRNTNEKNCSEFMLFALPQIDPGNYRVSVQVTDIMEKGSIVSSLILQAFVINPTYYAVFLGVRYSFFALSLTTAIFFLINYSKIPKTLRVFEHHAVVFMLIFLALFNDPLAYLNVVKPSKFSVFVSIFCITLYVTFLLFFWLVLFEVGSKLSSDFTGKMEYRHARLCSGGNILSLL